MFRSKLLAGIPVKYFSAYDPRPRKSKNTRQEVESVRLATLTKTAGCKIIVSSSPKPVFAKQVPNAVCIKKLLIVSSIITNIPANKKWPSAHYYNLNSLQWPMLNYGRDEGT